MPGRLHAERWLLHAAVPQRAVVERKAWALTTKPADSEKRLPVISIPATLSLPDLRVEIDLRSEAMSAGDKHWEAEVSARPQGADHEDVDTTKEGAQDQRLVRAR
jgi:hypothetical protein